MLTNFLLNNLGKLSISVQPRTTGGKAIENLVISFTLPKHISSAKVDSPLGTISFDQVSKVSLQTVYLRIFLQDRMLTITASMSNGQSRKCQLMARIFIFQGRSILKARRLKAMESPSSRRIKRQVHQAL
jgi:hypothetical protein